MKDAGGVRDDVDLSCGWLVTGLRSSQARGWQGRPIEVNTHDQSPTTPSPCNNNTHRDHDHDTHDTRDFDSARISIYRTWRAPRHTAPSPGLGPSLRIIETRRLEAQTSHLTHRQPRRSSRVLRHTIAATPTSEACAVSSAHNCPRPCRLLLFAQAQAGTRSSNTTSASMNNLRLISPTFRPLARS